MKKLLALWLLLASIGAQAANTYNILDTPSGGGFVYTGVLAGLPATCTVGQVAFITNATPGQNQYNCTATNTWTQNLNSGSGGASTALDNLAAVSINTSLLAQTGVDLGSVAKSFRDLFLFGAGTYGTNAFRVTGTPTGTRVITLPDATGTLLYSGGPGGTPASLVGTNITGTASGLTAGAVAVGGITGLGANCATWLATPTSANFAACVTGETGTAGGVVFSVDSALTGTTVVSALRMSSVATDYTGAYGATNAIINASNSAASGSIVNFVTSAVGPEQSFVKGRGTAAAGTIVASGDNLGSLNFYGAGSASGLDTGAAIRAFVDGTPGASGDMPGRLDFLTTPDGSGTLALRLRIGNAGAVNFQNGKVYMPQDDASSQTSAAIYAGTGTPNNSNGANGDFYLRGNGTAAGNTLVYHKESGSWVVWAPSGGSGCTVSGSNNQVLTDNGSGGCVSESNLTFDGSTLAVTGAVTISGNVTAANILGTGTLTNGKLCAYNSTGPVIDCNTTGGAGTVTNSTTLTSNLTVLGNGTVDTKVAAGLSTDGTATYVAGVNATTKGCYKMFGNTSGDVTICPNAVAGTATAVTMPASSTIVPIATQQLTFAGPSTARTITFPDASITVARTDAANTFTGTQTFGAVVGTTWNGNTWATGTGTLSIAAGKTFTSSNTLTITGTDSSSIAFGTGGTVTYKIAAGTSALATGAITSATCATVVTTTATGTATTDVINWGFNGDPTGVTGYVPLVAGMLTIIAYPSSNNVNFKVCNNTNGSVTPGAITLNWAVYR